MALVFYWHMFDSANYICDTGLFEWNQADITALNRHVNWNLQ